MTGPGTPYSKAVTDAPWIELACAVIHQACKDYYHALTGDCGIKWGRWQYSEKDCEDFFRSQYFLDINPTRLTGEEYIRHIKNDAEEANKAKGDGKNIPEEIQTRYAFNTFYARKAEV